MSYMMDTINEVAIKTILPSLVDQVSKTSPFLAYMKKTNKYSGEERLVALREVRRIARKYNRHIRMWHHNGRNGGWDSPQW